MNACNFLPACRIDDIHPRTDHVLRRVPRPLIAARMIFNARADRPIHLD